MSQFLNICTGPCTDVIEDPAVVFPFQLDDFQKHAIYHISKDENVLVTAPTGAGKTCVSTYGLAHALRKGMKAIYTSPIKSLSNQKFKEMKEIPELGGDIGILTGDIKFKPDARIMIMTTEILRNLLYNDGLKNGISNHSNTLLEKHISANTNTQTNTKHKHTNKHKRTNKYKHTNEHKYTNKHKRTNKHKYTNKHKRTNKHEHTNKHKHIHR